MKSFGLLAILRLDILILGLTIVVGFVGRVVFKYTKVPESLFMVLIGLAVGPVFGIVDSSLFVENTELVVTITLIIVLLDSGLSFNVYDVLRTLSKAVFFTIIVLFFSTLLIGSFMFFILDWSFLHSLLIGVISSGTTTIVVAFLAPRLSLPEDIKRVLVLESIINDVTLVTAAVLIIRLIEFQTIDFSQIIVALLSPIAMAIILGISFTILWVSVLGRYYKGEELTYVFTLGVLFLLYFFVELIGGNGAIAVLVYSLLLGNLQLIITKILDAVIKPATRPRFNSLITRCEEVVNEIRGSQVNFAFFIKNFFFVYLGIIFDPEKIDLLLISICFAILALMLLSRYISVKILSLFDHQFKPYTNIMAIMVARGFTATFVALLPSAKGIEIPQLKEIVLVMVLFSTFTTILGSIAYERRLKIKK